MSLLQYILEIDLEKDKAPSPSSRLLLSKQRQAPKSFVSSPVPSPPQPAIYSIVVTKKMNKEVAPSQHVSFDSDVKVVDIPATRLSMYDGLYYSKEEINKMKDEAISQQEQEQITDSMQREGKNMFDDFSKLNLSPPDEKGVTGNDSTKALEISTKNIQVSKSDKPIREHRPVGGRGVRERRAPGGPRGARSTRPTRAVR